MARNRRAAAESRDRKKRRVDELEDQVEVLERENSAPALASAPPAAAPPPNPHPPTDPHPPTHAHTPGLRSSMTALSGRTTTNTRCVGSLYLA